MAGPPQPAAAPSGWGYNLNRPVDRLVEEGGFEMAHLENFYVKGPRAAELHVRGQLMTRE